MKIFAFGNPDLAEDSLPLRVLPKLREQLPQHEFIVVDPNEEWDVPEDLLMIDTVKGIAKPQIFDSLEKFAPAPRVTMHDFDALTNLRYLQKLGKIKKIKIIGLPVTMEEEKAITGLVDVLNSLI